MHKHSGCCGCSSHVMKRRTFLAAVGGSALGAAALSGVGAAAQTPAGPAQPMKPIGKPLVVQPAVAYRVFERREATSWRPWGGFHTEEDIAREIARIEDELKGLRGEAEFPLEIRPVARVTRPEEGAALRDADADVMLIYAANSGEAELEALISPNRHNLMFVRHKSGPVYLYYEIAHPRFLRKARDEYLQPGLRPQDVVVDSTSEILWRLRALYGLKNTVGSRIVAIGDASGWGLGHELAPKTAVNDWKLDIRNEPYEDLGKRIEAARADAARVARAREEAAAYLRDAGIKLETDPGYVERAFLLRQIIDDLMAENDAPAITVNNCMTTIMPMSETTACLVLTLINDDGRLAFCESDFVVIPSGILLRHISGKPVFLNDPTYPHDGMVTVAHCTAPRRMNGQRLEPARILTHFESDYGAAPKVEMPRGETVTMIDPDFANRKWIGFRGKVIDAPFLDICRSQVDVTIEGDCDRLVQDMVGFHWMMSYGDYLKELGYALGKMGIQWVNLSGNNAVRA